MSEGLVLHGYQAGPDGFVQYGLGLNGEPPIDYLYLRALGGRQSGKSYGGGCRATIYATTFPESSGMIVSLTTDKLRDTILPTMFGIFRTIGMKLDQDYSYNKTERAITFLRNGSIIYLRTAEEPQNLPGPSLCWFWLDEFRAMPEDVFLLLLPTLSHANYPHQCWMTSTPAGKGHWSRKFWLPNAFAADYGVEPTILKGATMRSYQAWTEDNPHLSPVYLEVLNGAYKIDSAMWKQETRGEEVLMEGMVYDQFNHRIHMQPKESWPSKPSLVLAGVDFGFRAPSAIIVGGIDKHNRHYLLDEFYRSGMEESDLAKQAKKLMNRYHIQYFVCVTAETPILTPSGNKPISELQINDQVVTRHGPQRITAHYTIPNQQVYRVTLEDGTHIDATADHPLWVDNIGWCTVSLLEEQLANKGDVYLQCLPNQSTQNFVTEQEKYGSFIMDPSRRAVIYTTKTSILKTMTSLISNSYTNLLTPFSTTAQITAEGKVESLGVLIGASFVEQKDSLIIPRNTAQSNAETDNIETVENHLRCVPVNDVELDTEFARMPPLGFVPLRVLTISPLEGKQIVHDIRVENSHEFIANGILSHNCDNEDPGWIKAFRKAGLPAIPAKKVIGSRSDPSSGIGLCYSLLASSHPLGGPKIYINPSMVNFRREIENYIMEPDTGKINPTERPRQKNNHAMDAWRYLETALNYYYGDTMIPKSGKLTLKN